MPDYQRTKVACYLGFVTQAISANFAPLLFLKFHNDLKIVLRVTLIKKRLNILLKLCSTI